MSKKLLIIIVIIIIAILILVFLYKYDVNSNNDIDNLTEKDKDIALITLNNILTKMNINEERYYDFLSSNINSNNIDNFQTDIINDDIIASEFSSKTIYNLLNDLTKFLNSAMEIKIALQAGRYHESDISKYFNALEFNYISAEAIIDMLRYALKNYGSGQKSIFIPDKIIEIINTNGRCNKYDTPITIDDNYQYMTLWLMENNAIRAAFDKRFYQLLYGQNIYGRYSIRKLISEMQNISDIIDECNVPSFLKTYISNDELTLPNELYSKKILLTKKIVFNDIDDSEKLELIDEIFIERGFNDILADKIGSNGYQTLLTVVLHDLYARRDGNIYISFHIINK